VSEVWDFSNLKVLMPKTDLVSPRGHTQAKWVVKHSQGVWVCLTGGGTNM